MWPTLLKAIEKHRGEDLERARRLEAMPSLFSLHGSSSTREVCGITIDDDGANERCEILLDRVAKTEAEAAQFRAPSGKCLISGKVGLVGLRLARKTKAPKESREKMLSISCSNRSA